MARPSLPREGDPAHGEIVDDVLAPGDVRPVGGLRARGRGGDGRGAVTRLGGSPLPRRHAGGDYQRARETDDAPRPPCVDPCMHDLLLDF